MDVRIAARNVFRNTRRTVLTLMVIALGVAALIVFAGFIDNSQESLRETTIKNRFGHFQVAKRAYWEDRAGGSLGKFVIVDHRELRADFERLPHVRKVSATLDFMGLIGNGELSLAFVGRGMDIDPTTDPTWNFPRLVAGRVKGNTTPNAGFVGKGLVRGLRSQLHDNLVLLSTTTRGALNAVDVSVEGVLETGSREYDDTIVIIPLARAQALLNTRGVLTLTVFLDQTKHLPEILPVARRYIAERHPDLEIRPWWTLATFYQQVVDMGKAIFNVLGLIIGTLVTFSIVNTFLMSLFERVDEIGTMRAIGATRTRILRLFLLEGLVLGVIGGVVGVVVATVFAQLVSIRGIYIPPLPSFSLGYYARINVVPSVLVQAFAVGVATAVLASVYPAIRAARLNVIDAIRHV